MYSLQYNTRAKVYEIVKSESLKASYFVMLGKGSYQAMQDKAIGQHHSSLVL